MSIGIADVIDVFALQGSLTEHRARLDVANEQRRLSDRPADYSDVLVILESMINDLTRGSLRYLGESTAPNLSTVESLRLLASAMTKKRERFVEGEPTTFLAELVSRQEQNLRDIDYLRRGFGLGSGRPKPADMKWDHAGAVVSDVVDAFTRLVDSFRGEAAEIKRLIPEAELDLASTRRGIMKLLELDVGPSEFMSAVLGFGKSRAPGAGWDAFQQLPYEEEFEQRSSFFTDVVRREPPRHSLAGFYVGIAYPSRKGETVADLQLMGSDTYHPDSEEWLARISYTPKNDYAYSEVLALIYSLAYAPGGLGNAADYTLCLAWGTYLSRACAHRYLAEQASDLVGLRVGFGGGDSIDLGWIRSS